MTLAALVVVAAPALGSEPPEVLETPEGLEAGHVAANTVTLGGVLNPEQAGAVVPYEFRFLYRPSASECQGAGEKATPATRAGGRPVEAVKAAIRELLPDTQYTFCLQIGYAVSSPGQGTVLFAPVTFTTLAAAAPTTEEPSLTDVASTSATLHAQLSPQGAATRYVFEYAPAGGAFAPVPEPEGSGTLSAANLGAQLSVHIQRGLAPGASYEFRLVAGNSVQKDVAGEPVSFTTQRAGDEFSLPDNREYELVTPPEKQGALVLGSGHFFSEGSDHLYYHAGEGNQGIQASAAGNAIVELASQPTEAQPQGYDSYTQLLSTRSATGWSTQTIAPPKAQGGGPALLAPEYLLFSEDLSRGIVQPVGAFSPYAPGVEEQTPYLRTDYLNGNVDEHCHSSCFQPLVTRADDTASPFVPFGGAYKSAVPGFCENTDCGPLVRGASPDLSHVVFESSVQLTSTPLPAETTEALYEWYGGHLRLVGTSESELSLAGGHQDVTPNEEPGARRAISEDGERVITQRFISGAPPEFFGIYMSDVATGETVKIGEGTYLTASSDASRVFFLEGGNLDMFEVTSGKGEPLAGKVVDLTVDPHPGEAADVVGVLGASADGSYVYFAAGGVLAPGAVPAIPDTEFTSGTCSTRYAGTRAGCNIYVYHDGVTSLVSAGWIEPNEAFLLSRVSPDGRWLAFMSTHSLTGYDNRDANSGEPDTEVYLYDADTGRLACASCDPTGARPVGEELSSPAGLWMAANVPGWEYYFGFYGSRYQPRYLSNGGRLFFESVGALVPQDVNGVRDVYEYEPEGVPAGERPCSPSNVSGSDVFKPAHAFAVEGRSGEEGAGCVALISSGTSSEESSFLDASETGGDVFFTTTSKLAPQDFDDAADVYDAHECTSESPCATSVVVPPPCTTEASCKPSPTPQPSIYGPPSSATFSGPGNIAATPPPSPPKKVTKKTVKCKKRFVKNKKNECVRKKSKKKAKTSIHRKGSN